MKLKNILITSALAASALVTVPASALSVGCLGAGACASGVPNDYLGAEFAELAIEGWIGANLWLSGGPAINVQVDVFGAEAGYANSFNYGGDSYVHPCGTVFGSPGSPVDSWSFVTGEGSMAFNFGIPSVGTLWNGSNPDFSIVPNFFVAFGDPDIGENGLPDFDVDGNVYGGGSYVWLFLDDGGAGPDDNHDDMVVRLTVSGGRIVPEPATLGLLGLGLVGLGALRRRKTA